MYGIPLISCHLNSKKGEIRMNDRDLIGQWNINANNYLGKLELWLIANNWNGRLWFDAHQRWEQLNNISFNTG